jgi:hypothetical protein
MLIFLLTTAFSFPAETRYPGWHPKLSLLDRACWVLREVSAITQEGRVGAPGLAGGWVEEVTKDSITVRSKSGLCYSFEVSPELASKNIPLNSQQSFCPHRLNQVRVGDVAILRMVPTSRGYVVTALGICRRPGGKVPPGEDTHRPEYLRIHNYWNERQALEEAPQKLARMLARIHR